MLDLDWPWVLLLLPLPLLALLLPRAERPVEVALRLPLPLGTVLADGGEAARPHSARRRLALAWLAWALLVLAAARPQWLGEPLSLPLAGRDLLLALDLSGSMEQRDYELNGRPVSRLEAVRTLAASFVERRGQDRLGLILFGSQAHLQTPLTFDGPTVAAMLRETVVGLAGRETAIGDAIALGVRHLREQADDNRVLILLTDGASNAGVFDPLEAAELAAQSGVRIHAIGIGGGLARGRLGWPPRPAGDDFDPATLKAIADRTGGRFFAANDRAGLEAIYDELDRLEPSERDARIYRPRRALFVWPAALALALSVMLAVPERPWLPRRPPVGAGRLSNRRFWPT